MQHISAHLKGQGGRKDRASERGELMQYFRQKLNMTRARDGLAPLAMARMGRVLQAIPTSDLYFLKSICDDAQKRGGIDAFSKKFWWEVNPKHHLEEAKGQETASSGNGRSRRKKSQTSDYDA